MAITVTKSEMEQMYKDYAENRDKRNDIDVTFDNLNSPNPLEVLRVMDKAPTTEALIGIAETLCDGHTITFSYKGEKIKSIAYNKGAGNSLAMMLSDDVYLLDVLASVTYGLVLKKLTPHLGNSN